MFGEEELVVEFGLAKEFMRSLASGKIDPFIGLIGTLADLQEGELGLFQVLFQNAKEDWRESIVRSVTHADGKPFFVNAPELAKAAETKVSCPLFAVVVRIAVKAGSFERATEIASDLASSLSVFADPNGNELIPLRNDDYPHAGHVEDVIYRQTRRSGMLLNSDELAGLVHLPSSAVRSPAFQRQVRKTKAAPAIVQHLPGLLLGQNEHAGKTQEVRLSAEQRTKHCHIIGASGTGKSTLLFNLIKQDIENGEGVAVLDPHGDLIDFVLGFIPDTRIDDVVLVDPSDDRFSIGFNILSAHSELEKNLLASDLVAVFQRLSTSWGDQMNSVLQNAILAFLESDRHGTIADLRRFLIEKPYRNDFLKSVKDVEVVYYWQKSFPHLSGNKSIGSILTRLDTFLAQKPIRNMVSQPENKLDFAHIMDSGKIFLAKLPEGLLGRENSHLLGSLLVSKFQQIAMSRQAQQTAVRKDFWIYIDEFANFITPSMAEILSGARKYRIGLTLAHHELHQLQRNSEVASAVMSHPFTRIVFRVGDDDAKKLADGFSSFEAKDLRNLEVGQAVVRVERSDYDFNLSVPLPGWWDKDLAAAVREEVIAASRNKYGTLRTDVEAMLAKSREAISQKEPPVAVTVQPVIEVRKVAEVPKPVVTVRVVESKTQEPERPPALAQDLGRGGAIHKSIQERLQAEARRLGFLADVEKQLSKESNHAADLVVRYGQKSMAVEIAVSTTTDHEFNNVKKCLAAGFAKMVVVSPKSERLTQIAVAVNGGLDSEAAAKVRYFLPDQFITMLQELAEDVEKTPPTAPGERISHGIKVRRHAPQQSPEERKQKEEIARRMMIEAMRSGPK